jgi:uncharacterized membrane protein HdeD (DUF308 family)
VSELRTALARRLPWWLVVAIGAACVVLGAALTADPFRSLTVLAWLVAATLVVSGIAELASSGAASQPLLASSASCGSSPACWP